MIQLAPKNFKRPAAWAGKEVTMGIYKRPDSKKWWISYYLNGERVREGVSTNKREAEKVLMQRLTAINENKHPVLQKRKNKNVDGACECGNFLSPGSPYGGQVFYAYTIYVNVDGEIGGEVKGCRLPGGERR
jgi:hypothetical protein